ncbi:AraC family transcriptional regulator [Clostridium oryzae]|uniref:Transposon Tn10 TetD protein n=1 Tax=Clostridium oryzae TaxID=1450648 RepID=A0A1V4IJP2_9CLOT|nr:AraC family transcriptional regulator [Clostridium oryzae]OPJ59727.1 transposon Tn10 TetD protein [Clostridium oryzae]
MNNNNVYKIRIEAALEYLESNIDSELSLKSLANVSGFSPYHFHRIFCAITGQTLHKYILQRKLYLAANQLLYEDCTITQIALAHGFSTPSIFAKKFKELFNCTPTEYREEKTRKYPATFAKLSFPKYIYDETIEGCFFLLDLTDLKTICIGITGLSEIWENPEIEKAYQQIFQWLKDNGTNVSTQICGITIDTPEVQSLSECRYYACATLEHPMHTESLTYRIFRTSGKYICCKMNRNQQDFAANFFKYMEYLYGFYMPEHNLLPDYRPFIEFYTQDVSGNIIIQFCVPIKNSKK